MSSENLTNIFALLENEDSVRSEVIKILIRLADNVLREPNNPKYRRIKLTNPVISEKLLPACGALECLFEMGFKEDDDAFILPQNTSLESVKTIRNHLLDIQKQQVRNNENTQLQSTSVQSNATIPRRVDARRNLENEARFFRKLTNMADHVQIYEDKELQQKARSLIPSTALHEKARVHASTYSEGRDFLLLELLHWFKAEFFHWMDTPDCSHCGSNTVGVGQTPANPMERSFGASRVENYRCTLCQQYTRFPRYNNPAKLLETRCGRCGEWANCFTLCCRALGFDARYVLDWTDHVWTEVYSEQQQRWLHCDPCEDVCDKPLIYEIGWKKQLSYVIAFSKDEVQDVSWRYTCNAKEMLSHRQDVREKYVIQVVLYLTDKKQATLTESRKKALLLRRVGELAELLITKSATGEQMEGRQSGSLAWRLARGETDAGQNFKSFIIKPTSEEIVECRMEFTYNCATDTYVRLLDKDNQNVKGWDKLAFSVEGIFRKVEHDWDMVYLARTEGTAQGKLTWKVDLQGTGLLIEHVEVQVNSVCYENGQVLWTMCLGDSCSKLPADGKSISVSPPIATGSCVLAATLSGGLGDVAWQHAQLFRQPLADKNTFPMKVKIFLKKSSSATARH